MLSERKYIVMDMQEIGYFLFMEEQEQPQHKEVNAELKTLFTGEKATQTKEEQ